MNKSAALVHWMELKEGLPILEHMTPIRYKTTGSTYGTCGIRIDGNPAFVDAVLSRLKDLLDGENQITRLALTRATVKPKEFDGKVRNYPNADKDAEVCYVRLHQRGAEGSMVMALTGSHEGATKRYEKATRSWSKTAKAAAKVRAKALEQPIQFTTEYKAERAKAAAARAAAVKTPNVPTTDLKAALTASLKASKKGGRK